MRRKPLLQHTPTGCNLREGVVLEIHELRQIPAVERDPIANAGPLEEDADAEEPECIDTAVGDIDTLRNRFWRKLRYM